MSIVRDLRKLGYSVISLAAVKNGCPDLMVCRHGKVAFLEVKSENGELNERQRRFHAFWQGPEIAIVRSTEQAIVAIMKQWSVKK